MRQMNPAANPEHSLPKCDCYAMFGQPHFHDCPAGIWQSIPAQYKQSRWSFEYDEKKLDFLVHSDGHGICRTEDSEVAQAICSAFNVSRRESLSAFVESTARAICKVEAIDPDGGEYENGPNWTRYADAIQQATLATANETESMSEFDRLKAQKSSILSRQANESYVGWAHYVNRGEETVLQLCDSDSKGAFRIYR